MFETIFLTNKDWTGSHTLKIRSTIGTSTGKLYTNNYIDSTKTITLKIINPCLTTTFTIPTMEKKDVKEYLLEAREMGGQVIFQYEEPTDSASVTYGGNVGLDGYSLCGKRSHYITIRPKDGKDSYERVFAASSNIQSIANAPFL